jgi:hypothetical protein
MTTYRPVRRVVGAASNPATIEPLESRRLFSAISAVDSPLQTLRPFLAPLPNSVRAGANGTASLSVSNSSLSSVKGTAEITLLATTDGTTATTVATVRTVAAQIHLTAAQTIGSFQRFTLNFKYPSGLAAGRYQFLAEVNFGGAVLQAPVASQGVLIAAPFASLAANFTVAPTLLTVGRIPQNVLSLAVNNTGNVPVRGKVSVSVFASPTQTLGNSPDLLETFSNIPISIAANAGETVLLNQIKIPLETPIGDQYLIAVVNAHNTIPNLSTSVFNAVSPFPTTFTTAQFASVPAAVVIGKTVPFSLLVANAQTTAVNGRIDINLYQSPSRSLGGSSTLLETFSFNAKSDPW